MTIKTSTVSIRLLNDFRKNALKYWSESFSRTPLYFGNVFVDLDKFMNLVYSFARARV